MYEVYIQNFKCIGVPSFGSKVAKIDGKPTENMSPILFAFSSHFVRTWLIPGIHFSVCGSHFVCPRQLFCSSPVAIFSVPSPHIVRTWRPSCLSLSPAAIWSVPNPFCLLLTAEFFKRILKNLTEFNVEIQIIAPI